MRSPSLTLSCPRETDGAKRKKQSGAAIHPMAAGMRFTLRLRDSVNNERINLPRHIGSRRGFEMLWQAALEPLPRCSLVCASIKGGGRSLRPAPERRRHRGSGGEEDLGTRRMDDQLRQVTAIETVAGGDKGVAAVQ